MSSRAGEDHHARFRIIAKRERAMLDLGEQVVVDRVGAIGTVEQDDAYVPVSFDFQVCVGQSLLSPLLLVTRQHRYASNLFRI